MNKLFVIFKKTRPNQVFLAISSEYILILFDAKKIEIYSLKEITRFFKENLANIF
jgi:hypothetical protein